MNNQIDNNYTDILNTIVDSDMDKNEKIQMLNVIKRNLQLQRASKTAQMLQYPQQPMMMAPGQGMFQAQQPSAMTHGSLFNQQMMFPQQNQSVYMYEMINYKLNQLLMNVNKLTENISPVNENSIDEIINRVASGDNNNTSTNEPSTMEKIVNTVNNAFKLNDDDDEEEEEEAVNNNNMNTNNTIAMNTNNNTTPMGNNNATPMGNNNTNNTIAMNTNNNATPMVNNNANAMGNNMNTTSMNNMNKTPATITNNANVNMNNQAAANVSPVQTPANNMMMETQQPNTEEQKGGFGDFIKGLF